MVEQSVQNVGGLASPPRPQSDVNSREDAQDLSAHPAETPRLGVMKMGISDAIQEKGAPHDHLLGEPH